MKTAEQLLEDNERKMRGIRNTWQGAEKYETTKTLPQHYVTLHLQTTGLKPGADRIIQIGAIKYKNSKQVETYQTLINPQRFIPIDVTRSTKITNFLVEGAPLMENEIDNFLTFIDGLPIVTYNASFHMKFLYALDYRTGIQLPSLTVIDASKLARKALPMMSSENIIHLTRCLQCAQDPEDIMNHCSTVHRIYELCANTLK